MKIVAISWVIFLITLSFILIITGAVHADFHRLSVQDALYYDSISTVVIYDSVAKRDCYVTSGVSGMQMRCFDAN